MIEEIKKASDKAKHFHGSTDVIELSTLFRILDNQPDYKKLVEHLKTLSLGTQELDYDYDDEAILNFEYFDWDLYIENWFEVEKYNLGGE